MHKTKPVIYLKDYKKPDYKVSEVFLDFTLDEVKTKVASSIKFSPAYDSTSGNDKSPRPLFLNGEDLTLESIKLDGETLAKSAYKVTTEGLTLLAPPTKPFTLDIVVTIDPKANSKLMGLYMSDGIFCTQCEPEGFRRITYYLDHPDVMAKFKVKIRADKNKYPVRLSNGNVLEETDEYIVWEDPFAKPCYLFAMVVADYGFIEDSFTTRSGKPVTLRIYAAKGKEPRLYHAMASLKKAMKWDEEAFGREYDLDLFNIVAVHDFNVGAMENKSLNIFNEKVLLADPETSTDADYANVEDVVAHEYFHNWSGDRVTARDWFNLSLKEGFTVYRTMEFTSDMHSRAVERINNVIYLKGAQFPEDAGPLAHPVQPQSYMEIDNFYTVTVYEKGAEVIRMQAQLLGKDTFRKGTDLYFSRHDGEAVTIDDFVKCMEDASGKDLTQFKRWYSEAGTPHVKAESNYNVDTSTLTLTLSQHTNPTPNQPTKLPFVIPIEVGLIGADGKDLRPSEVLVLDQETQTFTFEGVKEKPVLSLNRSFTAPIVLNYPYTDEELVFLMKHDSDLFNRWEAGQTYALKYIKQVYDEVKAGKPLSTNNEFLSAFATSLDIKDDKDFAARALRLPTAKAVASTMDKVDFVALHEAMRHIRTLFANTYKDKLLEVYHANADATKDPADISAAATSARALRLAALSYLALLRDEASDQLVRDHYANAVNMTDASAGLALLVNYQIRGFEDALGDFYWNFKDDPLVLNKWLMIQSCAEDNPQVLADVKKLMEHKAFDLFNPNSVYSLIGGFAINLPHLHAADGSGYDFLAQQIMKLDEINPHISARLLTYFSIYKKLEDSQQALMKKALDKIAAGKGLSPHISELLGKILA